MVSVYSIFFGGSFYYLLESTQYSHNDYKYIRDLMIKNSILRTCYLIPMNDVQLKRICFFGIGRETNGF